MKSYSHFLFSFCLLLLCMTACTNAPKEYYVYTGQLHTPYHIKYEYDKPLDGEIQKELERFYYLFNAFDSTSVVSQINRNQLTEIEDSAFRSLFRTAMLISAFTDGAYDITCAPLINLWGFGFSKKDSVTPEHIDSVRQFIGYQKIHLEQGKVTKDDPRLIINCSSLADGTVCDMIADLFDSKGIANYMVEFGGEIVTKGVNQRGEYWKLGITRPTDDNSGVSQDLTATIRLWPEGQTPETAKNNGRRGMATSGNYRNYYVKDGKKYAHTIDPREGCPVQRDVLSATIIAPTAMLADACATACMVLGSQGAETLKQKLPEIEYFLICSGDSTGFKYIESSGFSKYLISMNE